MRLRMGTRGSALALAQSGWVAERLRELHTGLEVETAVIKTSGDLFATESPRELYAAQGTKGLFVKEIEEALQDGRVDLAVHSAKDLPGSLAPGLAVAAYPEREDPRDAFIGRDGLAWGDLRAPARIGTSSLRRKVQVLAVRPGLEVLPLRGNVDTRLRKLREGRFDGLVIAAAGLRRLGRSDVPHELIPTDVMLPAPGQGALAVETRADREDLLGLIGRLDHAATRLEVEWERAFLVAMGGGCSTPLGALACARDGEVELSVFWSDAEGRSPARLSLPCPEPSRREGFAAELAARLRRNP